MSGYSKLRLGSTTKSKSIDFSDIFTKPLTSSNSSTIAHTPKPTKQERKKDMHITQDPFSRRDDEREDGKPFGLVLSRNYSASSTALQRCKGGGQSTVLQSAVKRAFSLRRSTSVSEGYCRIYDHNDPTLCSPVDLNETVETKSKKKKRGSKIIRVCRSIFGM